MDGRGSVRKHWLGWWLIHAVALIITASLLRGIDVSSFWAALLAAALLGLANVSVRPLLLLLTLPLNLATLGIFTFVVNGIVLWMVSWVAAGFVVHGFWAGVWGALVLSLVSWGLRWAMDRL
ncbi:hypothetical protein LIP_2912 [Limnochorda pilosa]|uniref:Phage holin family protein n=1 Tax=Limnochorda pilosa TaxID=1555112 RepID=A0A0K2SNR5_LIMPI|nr:hypothetical protein LIP_2912 [Limnochorda pilosa]